MHMASAANEVQKARCGGVSSDSKNHHSKADIVSRSATTTPTYLASHIT